MPLGARCAFGTAGLAGLGKGGFRGRRGRAHGLVVLRAARPRIWADNLPGLIGGGIFFSLCLFWLVMEDARDFKWDAADR